MNVLKKLNIKNAQPTLCSGNAGHIDSLNPTTEKIIASVLQNDESDYEKIIQQSHAAFLQWRDIPAPKRGEVVRQIGEKLREKKDYLGTLVSMEMGKSKQEGDGEVQEMIDMADFAVGQSRMLYGNTMHSERAHHRMYEQWHPLGIVGVISAFNFPVAVWAWNAFIAAICGNTVVWKPSSKTPLCALAVQQICDEVMEANDCVGVFSTFITSDRALSNQLLDDDRLPLISFTGSSHVGAHVSETVAKRMGRTILECSGNNAIILDDTADLTLAIPAIVFGAIGTSGQRCTSTRRLFLHTSLYDTVIEQLVNAYKTIHIGDPLDEKNHMGPLIDASAVTDFERAITATKKENGEILFGGNMLDQTGYFVEPTLALANNDWDIVQRETFAPILYVMQYEHFEDAITLQNRVCQGLSSALFTQDLKRAETFLSCNGSDCGIANINIGTSGAEIGGAFGGEKATGGGREAGSDSWKAYMRRQTNTINWSNELPLAQGIDFKI